MIKTFGHRLITGAARGPVADLARAGLTVASWGYGPGVRAARGLYAAGWRRPHRLARPVVSVGNVTWGGTGKTPFTAHVACALRARGARPAVLLRGYGGDEAAVLRRLAPGVPVIANPDRVAGGGEAVAQGADLLLLDDGFQHWRLHRDLDIVLVDATAPFGNGHLAPRGSLRESPSALRRAGVIVVTRAEMADPAPIVARARAVAPKAWVTTARTVPTGWTEWPSETPQPLSALRARRVLVLSGLANPDAFEALVYRLGAQLASARRFLDHHPYRPAELAEVADAARGAGCDLILTTWKDAARFPAGSFGGMRVGVLDVAMEIDGEGELLQRILSLRGR